MTTPGPFQPGDIIGGQWEIAGLIGEAPAPGSECDAESPSAYMMPGGGMACRCMVCPRCHHHTGNSHQGHYWAYCRARRGPQQFHFCCDDPAYGCELEAAGPDAIIPREEESP